MRNRVTPGLAIALAIAAVAAVAAFGFSRGIWAAPVAWATLGTADVHSLAFGPDDANRLYFGHHGGLLESTDGGRSWAPAALVGADAMNVASASTGRMYVAGHELFVESTDGGASWQRVEHDLPGLDLHSFAVDPTDDDRAWAVVAGQGLFESTDAGRQWELRQPGNWGYLVAYRDGEATALVAVGQDGLVRSPDGGATWQPLAYPGAPLTGGLAAASDGSALYAATTAGLRRSTDQGETWSDTGFDDAALTVAISRSDSMDVAVIDDETRLYRSSDGGATWPGP